LKKGRMIDQHLFLVFMAGAIALNFTPGPDMAFVLAQSAGRGPRVGVAAALGIGAGTLFHMVLAAFGLAALFAAWPLAFDIVRYAGAAYLVWIAIGMFRSPPHLSHATREANAWAAFRQGVTTNVLNPKVAMFFIAFLPQFVTPGLSPAWAQILLLGLAFDISGTLVNVLVALGSGRLAERLKHDPRIGSIMGWISGSVMCALALRLAWPDRR
jgi:threonine/homoserine/homoserine lactone efflux protein